MEKIRIKKNYKPKANDEGKENNAIFFETWPKWKQNTDVPYIACPWKHFKQRSESF